MNAIEQQARLLCEVDGEDPDEPMITWRGIYSEYTRPPYPQWEDYTEQAENLAKAGLVIVPREPTNKMLNAAGKAMSPEKRPTPKRVSCKKKHKIRYQAMIGAAE